MNMESKKNLSTHSPRKSRSPQMTRKTIRSTSLAQSRLANESLRKINSTNTKIPETKSEGSQFEFSSVAEEIKDMSNHFGYFYPKRPSTVSGTLRKKSLSDEEKQSHPPSVRKSFFMPAKNCEIVCGSVARADFMFPSLQSKNVLEKPNKTKNAYFSTSSYEMDLDEDLNSDPLLLLAAREQDKVIKSLCAARNRFYKKIADDLKLKTDVAGDYEVLSRYKPPLSERFSEEPSSSFDFDNSYSATLEEICQAWMYLFYFIINLRINLVQIIDSAQTEGFIPNVKAETDVITKAIKSVKIFSELKIKSLMDSLEEFQLSNNRNINEKQIRNYEEKLSTSFFFEMDFIQKKAKEISKMAGKRKTIKIT